MSNGRPSVTDTAARMGVTPMFLRMWLRSGKCPFGHAIQMPGGRWSYYINRERFERYMRGEDMTGGGPGAMSSHPQPANSRAT